MKTREVEGREGGDTEEFIRSNKEQEETEGEGDKERGRERSRELYKEEEEKKNHLFMIHHIHSPRQLER